MKYIKFHDGEKVVINTKKELLKLACCDCALVHYMSITIVDDEAIRLEFVQDKQSTAQLRRREYGFLQQGINPKYNLEKVLK